MEKITVYRGSGRIGTFPLAVRKVRGLSEAPEGASGPVEESKVEVVAIEGALYRVLDKAEGEENRRVVLPA